VADDGLVPLEGAGADPAVDVCLAPLHRIVLENDKWLTVQARSLKNITVYKQEYSLTQMSLACCCKSSMVDPCLASKAPNELSRASLKHSSLVALVCQ
jgi:hypothetical protein